MYKYLLPLGITALSLHSNLSIAAEIDRHIAVTGAMASATIPMTLEQAWQLADNANPALWLMQAKRAAAEGDAADTRGLLWNNPKLSGERVRRDVPEAGTTTENRREWSAAIEQTFEIAGQQGHRRRAAQQELDALDATIEETRREVHAEVEQRFVEVLALQERIATESAALKIIEDTAASVGKRVKAGEDSRLDGNLAKVEAVRARNQIGMLQEQLMQARAELASTLQLPTSEIPVLSGTLNLPAPTYTLMQLQESAGRRPLLRSLDYKEQSAASRLSLERAARYPDVTVAVSTGREGPVTGRERLTGISVSIPIPLFHHNSGAIGRAATELAQTRIERQAAIRNTDASVVVLWQRLQSLTNRVDALQSTVLPALEDNQQLSVKSLKAGEISLVQLLLVNRQVLDGRRDLIDAQTELRMTRIALEQTAGWVAPNSVR